MEGPDPAKRIIFRSNWLSYNDIADAEYDLWAKQWSIFEETMDISTESEYQRPLEYPQGQANNPIGASGNNTKARPCDACRRRRSRCVPKEGALKCVLCEFHNQDCTYVQTPQARKRKSVSISQDEETPVSKRSLDSRSLTQNITSPPKADQAIDDYKNLKGPSLLKKTLGLQRRRHGLYQGQSGCFEAMLVHFEEPLSKVSSLRDSHLMQANSIDQFLLLPDEATDHYDHEVTDLDAIEAIVAPHGQTLINVYFRIVHPSFPILHKKVFLEKYSRTHQEFSPPLLAAVYILALQYWSYENELLHFKKPEVNDLEELAVRSLAYVVHRPKLSTVEAGLLLLQWRTGSASWALTAQMVAVGQDLGLHRDCSSWNIPDWERGLRKRLAWALFMQDKWSSLVHGRPSHINDAADWAVQPLTDRDFPENAADDDDREGSTEVEKGRSSFCNMVSLSQILSDILTLLYSAKAEAEIRAASGADATKLVLSKLKPLHLRLSDWYAGLPESLNIEDVKIRKLSSTGYLHIAYWAAEISVHRVVLRATPSCYEDAELRQICRTAAQARLTYSMKFVKSLKPEHLQSFWYFASAFNFALVGLFQTMFCITADTKEEMGEQWKVFEEYRWLLRVSSKSGVFLQQAMETMDVSTEGVRDLVLNAGSDGEGADGSRNENGGLRDKETTHWNVRSPSARGEDESFEQFEGDQNASLGMDDTSLAWYQQAPLDDQAAQAKNYWEGLKIALPCEWHEGVEGEPEKDIYHDGFRGV